MNRLRTLVVTAAGAAVLAAGLGGAALGTATTAKADICWNLEVDGTTTYYYC